MGILTDINDAINQSDKELKNNLMNKYHSLSPYFKHCICKWSKKENCPYYLIHNGVQLGVYLTSNVKYCQNELIDFKSKTITIPDWIDFRLPCSYTAYYKKTGEKTVINIIASEFLENYTVQFEDGSLEKEYHNVILKIVRSDDSRYNNSNYVARYVAK